MGRSQWCMGMNDSQTDARLVQAYLAGKSGAFEKLYERYERPLFSYLLKLIRERQAAEDIFQQTWMKVIKALPVYEEKSKFSSWLFGIAHNCCIDYIRRVSNRREDESWSDQLDRLGDGRLLPDAEAEKNDDLHHLARAIDQLPGEQRAVVLMRIHGETPFREISDTMNC